MIDLDRLEGKVGACQECDLCRSAENRVFGSGSISANLMFVGDAPGREENAAGIPFVGDAGQLLNKALEKLGVSRDITYGANLLKCWPPGNRKPEKHEIATCVSYLEEQIRLIQPKVLLALGAASAQTLLQINSSIGKIRGRVFAGPHEVLTVPTWHPGYILRCGSMRGGSKSRQKKAAKEFIADLKLALDLAEVKWEEAE